ncbi:MAG TPA: transposase [Candidatus Sulfotelmatobacter sp.]|nr:transposase [Candidatus Sulfotelmatobacter sp.]
MKPTPLISPPGTYFTTTITFQRRRFFIVESHARLFLKTLYHYRSEGRFQIHVFVLMPDHVYLLITPAPDVTIERAMQLMKGGYSHAVGKEIGRRESGKKDSPTIVSATPRTLPDTPVHTPEPGDGKAGSRSGGASLLLRLHRIPPGSVAPSG